MKKKYLYLLSILFVFSLVACGSSSKDDPIDPPQEPEKPIDDPVKPTYTFPMDGPYIIYENNDKVRVISISEDGVFKDETLNKLPDNYSFEVITHDKKHRFSVKLFKPQRQEWKQDAPDKVLAISDPHGNFDCFYSVLRANGVINDAYGWTFGKNHLLINGDVFDRGDDVLPIFWLTYKLQKEASDAGGAVHFLLGNHESMVLRGDLRYMNGKYSRMAQKLGFDYSLLFAANTELGKWIGLANTMQIIGSELYVHAGLAQGMYDYDLPISYVNAQMSRGIFLDKDGRDKLSDYSKYLFSSSSSTQGGPGPVWYRGMVGYDGHEPLKESTLELLLERYGVDRVVVGHTVMNDVSAFYSQRVIAINVDNQSNFDRKAGRGILVEGSKIWVINDKGEKSALPESK